MTLLFHKHLFHVAAMLNIEEKPVLQLKEHGLIPHPGVEEKWNLEKFRSELKVKVISATDTLEFDLIGVDCSFANAIRRILMAEVPSVCIERVYMHQNTSVMPDEVLCHRLGLVPLTVDPNWLSFPSKPLPTTDETSEFNPSEHLLFDLKVQFNKSSVRSDVHRSAQETQTDSQAPVVKSMPIYSSDLKWIPLPGQEEMFGETNQPTAVSSSILLNKLVLGDEIKARCVAVKGTGRDHAKFSPVSAAYYKFLPIIRLLRAIEGEEAKLLQKSFTSGVIEINSDTNQAYVNNPRLDNGSREHMRHPNFGGDSVFVGIDPNHCIFSVESISADHRPPIRLVRSAIDVMLEKCKHYLAIIDKPDFGEKVAEQSAFQRSVSGQQQSQDCSYSTRSQLHGREVGLEVTSMTSDKSRVTYTFHGEDHTLGCALRFCVLKGTKASFCGYCVPHPLEDKIHFDIQVKNGNADEVLREGLQCLLECFTLIKAEFKNAVSAFKKQVKTDGE